MKKIRRVEILTTLKFGPDVINEGVILDTTKGDDIPNDIYTEVRSNTKTVRVLEWDEPPSEPAISTEEAVEEAVEPEEEPVEAEEVKEEVPEPSDKKETVPPKTSKKKTKTENKSKLVA